MILALWTAEEDATIIRLRAQKLSASHIASFLPGRSRNAVIGRANRLLGKGIEVAPAKKQKAKPKVVKEKTARITLAVVSSPMVVSEEQLARRRFRKALKHGALGGIGNRAKRIAVTIPSSKVERREDVPAPQPSEAETILVPTVAIEIPKVAPRDNTPRHFLDVRTFDCRYPLWHVTTPLAERVYCCQPIDRGSYCTEHASLCYVPVKPPREAPYRERRAHT